MDPSFYQALAINEAWKYQILTYPNPAVGALILNNQGKILALCAHEKAGFAHAELAACAFALLTLLKQDLLKKTLISLLYKDAKLDEKDILALPYKLPFTKLDANKLYDYVLSYHKGLFKDATLFCTLMPCSHSGKTPSCAKLIAKLGFKLVYISCKDPYSKGGDAILQNAGIVLKTGLCKEAGLALLWPFLCWQKDRFSFFKLALSLNGSALGKITHTPSKAYMHALRSVSDALLCGGNTLRIDKPLLDARLANTKPPTLVVKSRNKALLKDIPALNVANRKVCFNTPNDARLLMYEGGEGFLKSFANELNWLLLMNSSSFNTLPSIVLKLGLTPLYNGILGKDTFTWFALKK